MDNSVETVENVTSFEFIIPDCAQVGNRNEVKRCQGLRVSKKMNSLHCMSSYALL